MYLLDTNILLELLLDQARADEVEEFLRRATGSNLFLSEFTLYSLGIILLRLKRADAFLKLKNDLLARGGVQVVRIRPEEIEDVVTAAKRFNLYFDDAYQYTAAKIGKLEIISFDADFDRTDCGRKTPNQVLRSPRQS